MPKISVVMPVYNSDQYLKEAIDSILAQTYRDFEFIIIDDGSTDTSPDVVRSYDDPRIRFYINEKNMGVAATLNRGLDLATGAYIARMDSDDISLPERFEKQVEFLDAHPKVAVCATGITLFGTQNGNRIFSTGYKQLKVDLIFGCCFAHPTVMMRSDVFRRENLYYDLAFEGQEDYELWFRISRQHEIASLRAQLVKYRVHKMQVTQNYTDQYDIRVRQLKQRILGELGLCDEEAGLFCAFERNKSDSTIRIAYIDLLKKIIDANNEKKIYDKRLLKGTIASLISAILNSIPVLEAYKVASRTGINAPIYCFGRASKNILQRIASKARIWGRRKALKHKDFTIISNNCWGSFIYQKYGLPYRSPTAGLYILGHDFVKLCANWENYFQKRLEFIPWESCTHYDEIKDQTPYPVARLGDIEIYFMHYKTVEEAAEKWYRRIGRINSDRMLFKLSEREGCSKEDIEHFISLPLKNKLCFAYDNVPGTIYVPELEGLIGDEFETVQRYVNDADILNNL